MKKTKIISIILSVLIVQNAIPTFAYTPKIIGEVLSTDILAFVDEQPIRSYNYKDRTYVMAEDLRNYGFDVAWDATTRTLNITLPPERIVKEIPYEEEVEIRKKVTPGQKQFDVYQTDIRVLFDGEFFPDENNIKNSINVNGNTLVLLHSLDYFGEVIWEPENPYRRTSSLYTKGKTCTTDFGFKYQETERIPENHYSFDIGEGQHIFDHPVFDNPAYDGTYEFLYEVDLGVFDYRCLSDNQGHVYYAKVEQELLDMLQIKFIQIDDTKIEIESNLDANFIGTIDAGVSVMQEPHSVYKINFSLYKDGNILEMPGFPTFLSMKGELFINFDILAQALDMKEYTGNEFGYWANIYTKGEANTSNYWKDFFTKQQSNTENK